MRYVALLYGKPDAGPAPGTPEFMEMLGEFQSATAAMADAGVLVDSSPLQPPQAVRAARRAGAHFSVTVRMDPKVRAENAADRTPSEMRSVRRPPGGSCAPVTAATYRPEAHRLSLDPPREFG